MRSYLNYCNIIWVSYYPERLKHLEVSQKRIVRIVCHARTNSIFEQLNLLKLKDINILHLHNLCINTVIVCCLLYLTNSLYLIQK